MRRQEEVARTLGGGLAAITSVTALAAASDALGLLQLSFGRVLGTMLGPDRAATRAAGWTWHVLNGVAFALAYRELFRRSPLPAGPVGGAAAGVGHCLLGTAAIALLPRLHPRPLQAGLRSFGPAAYGPMTLPGMLLGHVFYGAIVGWFLRPARPEVAARVAQGIASRPDTARIVERARRAPHPLRSAIARGA